MGKTTPSVVSTTGLDQASAGNPALRQMLQQLSTAANTQATKTNTSAKGAPNQSSATVSYQNPFYIVTFLDPGGATAASLAQAAQQAAGGTLGSNAAQSVLYHQVQAATSILFDAANSLKTYGGDTGTLQTQFTIADLDSTKQWYFRVRTSFDGQTWTQWKIVNNKAVVANTNGVALTGVAGGSFAAITLPGKQTVGFGMGQIADEQVIGMASGVLMETSIGIAGAGTVNDTGSQAIGISACSISSLGVANLLYRAADVNTTPWGGNVNFLTFGYAEGSQNLAIQTSGGGNWIICTAAGGSRFAVGSGMTAPGGSFTPPGGFSVSNMMALATPASVVPPNGHDAHGIKQSNVVVAGGAATPTVLYGDGSGNTWQGNANWFAVCWEPALNTRVVNVAGGKYLILPTPSGPIAIGSGSTESGGVMPLPPGGYTYQKCLAFGCVDGYTDVGDYMHGIAACTVNVGLSTSDGTGYALYTNGTQEWPGLLDWFSVAWP